MNGRSATSSFESGGIDLAERKEGNEDLMRIELVRVSAVSRGVLSGECECARM